MRVRVITLSIALHAALTPVYAQVPEQAAELDTIEVVGEKEAFVNLGIEVEREEADLTPGGVSVIEGDILYERNISNLADMLRYVPGVFTASQSGDDGIFLSSRGSNLDATDFDRNGIKLFHDGLPITTADGNNHNRIIDPLSAGYAVFARGANGMKYGASTLGGAINFISPTAHDSAAAEVFLNGGSHHQIQGRATLSKIFDDRFDGLATLEGKHRDGYRDQSKAKRTGIYANGGWQLLPSLGTRLYATYVDNYQELPGQLSRAQFEDNPDQASASALGGNFLSDVETWRLADKTTWQIDEHRRLDFGVSYEEQTLFHPIVDKVVIPGVGLVFNGLLIDTDHRDIGAMARYEHKITNHDLLFGINLGVGDVEGEHFGNAGGVRDGLSTLIDQQAHNLETYAMDRWHLGDAWTLVPALQFVNASRELNNTDVESGVVDDTEDDYSGANPSFGVIRHVRPEIDIFASVSRLYEPPTTFELADDVQGGGAALEAMDGTVVEVGTRGKQSIGQRNRWGWDLSVYYAWINDEILSVDDPLAPGTSLSTNVDDTLHADIEALINASFALDAGGVHAIEPQLSLTVNEFNLNP